ncbi:MAG: queuosine precursor transporter [Propionibacteriaceae bacterium]|nr:queuosine precursor transporter [Propionibacteriaceae bacterium]
MTKAENAPQDRAHFAQRGRGNYDLIVALFCSFLLISNVSAVKLIAFGPGVDVMGFPLLPLITDGGALLFPLTYIFGDVLAEVYGFRGARRAIIIGFAVSVLASLTFLLVGIAPPAADWHNQEAFDAILGFVPRIVFASLLGYFAGQLLNAFVLVRLKERAPDGSLWSRLLGSTLVGEAADTTIFCIIAFGGIVTGGTLVNYILVGYIYKVLVEVLLMPVTYRVIALVKKHEPSLHQP